jgi:hypothetical protein
LPSDKGRPQWLADSVAAPERAYDAELEVKGRNPFQGNQGGKIRRQPFASRHNIVAVVVASSLEIVDWAVADKTDPSRGISALAVAGTAADVVVAGDVDDVAVVVGRIASAASVSERGDLHLEESLGLAVVEGTLLSNGLVADNLVHFVAFVPLARNM